MKRYLKYWWKRLKRVTILAALLPGLAFAEFTREEIEQELVRRAAARTEQEREEFELFAHCRPMRIRIIVHDEEFGLQEEGLRATLESRLRAARLYREDSPYHLDLQVMSAGRASYFMLGYVKIFHDHTSGHWGLAPTWVRFHLSSHYDVPSLMSEISQTMDRFIAAYLRVNERACD